MSWLNRSNVDTHGLRWAFDLQYARHIKAGWSDAVAFAFACNAIFGRMK